MLAKKTLQLLKKYNIRLNKRRGQNYLIDTQILSQIIDHSQLNDTDIVLEIGAGIGTLTLPLSETGGKVLAVEQDPRIVRVLKERLDDLSISNVEILEVDATRMEFPPFNKVVANLPYQISSPITFKLLHHDFDWGILMYQLEFAQRMIAKPGKSDYSRLSVMMHLCSLSEVLFKVPRGAFIPKPKVSSAVVKIIPKKNPAVDEFFLNTCRALFQHKKKKAKKALLESFHEIAIKEKGTARDLISNIDTKLIEER
ncbi:MAG: 16S rRNA (adenine(1518)-N(6)/adenine(1519)-N(6))-dimethyltransferase RsmA, partial [Methanobacteriaceae archaeon]